MKKIIFLFIIFLGLTFSSLAQEKRCYCNLVENYTKDAKKVYAGEILMVVPEGNELWIDMRPIAHQRNQGERGGCRLVAGQKYVADKYTSEPKRAYDCGNPIRNSIMYVINYKKPCGDCGKNQAHTHYTGCGHAGYETHTHYTGCGHAMNMTDNWSDPIPTDTKVNQNFVDTQQGPFVTNVNQNPVLTQCQLFWKQKYPDAYNLWLQTRKRNAFNTHNIPYGPDRRKMRRCFKGPSVFRVIAGVATLGTIGLGTYALLSGESGKSGSSGGEYWGPNDSGGE